MKYLIPQNKTKFDYCNIPLWHNRKYTGTGIKIGVIFDDYKSDTPTFNDKVHGISQFNTGISGDIHGFSVTHVLTQLAIDADIYYLPYSSFDFDSAIDWAIENKINILSMSFRGSSEQWFVNASKKAVDNGIVLICSAGNNGDGDNTLGYAAKSDIWISIGACDLINGKIQRLDTSSVGEQLDFCGLSNIAVGTDYNNPLIFSQTSCAVPFIVGQLALWMQWYKEKYNKYPNQQITYEFMKNNCENLEVSGKDSRTGWGLFHLPKEIDSMEIELQIGIRIMKVDEKTITLDVAPKIENGRTLVPLRAISEAFGAIVELSLIHI